MSLFHKNTLLGASGAGDDAAAASLYVDDVFAINVWTGNSTARDITNDIDLPGEGGMVWIKSRTLGTVDHNLYDTERGATKDINTNNDLKEGTNAGRLSAFNSDGYSLGSNSHVNGTSSYTYVGWTFRKAPGFFDVVTYAGNSTSGRGIPHSLGSVPGSIWVKNLTDDGEDFMCYHRALAGTHLDAHERYMKVNSSDDAFPDDLSSSTASDVWGNTAPDANNFYVGDTSDVNATGKNYVAYVFAHDDQSFGTNSDEAIIKCASYQGNGSTTGPEVDLGFEPQYLLIKGSDAARNWWVIDNMRGMPAENKSHTLRVNTTGTEITSQIYVNPKPTGFQIVTNAASFNTSGDNYTYIAIRRPHKPPTTGTDVFALGAVAGNGVLTSGFPIDLGLQFRRDALLKVVQPRLLGEGYLRADNTNTFSVGGGAYWVDSNTEYPDTSIMGAAASTIKYAFKRAPGFMDVVVYKGTGLLKTENHGLGVTPELILIKNIDVSGNWRVYNSSDGANFALILNSSGKRVDNAVYWNDTEPTSTQFTVNTNSQVNGSTNYHVALLFATLSGISKVGSYPGTGNDVDVNCGFSAGARFVMIKRTDNTGDWHFFDTARGIATGNDPWITTLSSSETTNTDYIDPLNSGFTVTSSAPAALNANGGTYIFLAIA